MDFSRLFNFGYFFPSFSFRPVFNFSTWDFFSPVQFPVFNIFGNNYNNQPLNVDKYQPSEVPVVRPEQPKITKPVVAPVTEVIAPAVKKTPIVVKKIKKVANKKTISVKNSKKASSDTKINQNADNMSILGYNWKAGEQLARTALSKAVGWTGYCARYVKTAIRDAGLGEYVSGHAFQMPNILRKNRNFRELSPYQVDVKRLPAGCILVYGRGVSGYSSQYGHIEITTGDGRAVSDGITRHLRKNPTAIFMPVEQNNVA